MNRLALLRVGRTRVGGRGEVIGHIGRFEYINKTSSGPGPDYSQDSYTFFEGFDKMHELMSKMRGYISVTPLYHPNTKEIRDSLSVTGQVGDCAVNITSDTAGYTHLVITNQKQSKRQATLKRLEGAFK